MLNEELETYKAKVWWDRVLEILIIKILVLDVLGRTDEALEIMLNALELAKPAGYVRLFLDEGDQIVKYLYASSNQMTSAGNYARHLLAQFTETPSHISYINEDQDVQIEPLTRRELEILKLIANGLTNKEIGQKLSISLGTVKRHAANINGKLNTDNRIRAVVVARKLKIIN